MFKKPANFDAVMANVKEGSTVPTLPRGNYICKIRSAEERVTKNGSPMISMEFDICEGEFAGYYAEKYRHRSENPDGGAVRWQGTIPLFLPDEDEGRIKRFGRTINYFEDANEGFHFDWNGQPSQFEDLIIGIKFEPNDYDFDGKTGEWQKPKFFESVSKIREGKSSLLPKQNDSKPAAEMPKGAEPIPYNPKTVEELPDDDLPF